MDNVAYQQTCFRYKTLEEFKLEIRELKESKQDIIEEMNTTRSELITNKLIIDAQRQQFLELKDNLETLYHKKNLLIDERQDLFTELTYYNERIANNYYELRNEDDDYDTRRLLYNEITQLKVQKNEMFQKIAEQDKEISILSSNICEEKIKKHILVGSINSLKEEREKLNSSMGAAVYQKNELDAKVLKLSKKMSALQKQIINISI